VNGAVNTVMLTIPLAADAYAVRVVAAQSLQVHTAWTIERMLFTISAAVMNEEDLCVPTPSLPGAWCQQI
jgi:hypothetical protein